MVEERWAGIPRKEPVYTGLASGIRKTLTLVLGQETLLQLGLFGISLEARDTMCWFQWLGMLYGMGLERSVPSPYSADLCTFVVA